jgi:hypothetical protein
MAGGNVKKGATFGATDDFSVRAAGARFRCRDVHATLLHLMGLERGPADVPARGAVQEADGYWGAGDPGGAGLGAATDRAAGRADAWLRL